MNDDRTQDWVSAEAVRRETDLHGEAWKKQCGGYFAEPENAVPFVDVIERMVLRSRPDVVLDLGGGTGFLLDQLSGREGVVSDVRLVNMDLSEAQLEVVSNPRIEPLQGSYMDFRREQVVAADETLLAVTRSTLHYAGVLGQRPALHHIREQLREGEYFIHQTLAASSELDALLADELMERMHSDKWLPSRESLVALCREASFEVEEVCAAPPIMMNDRDLAIRYRISPEEMAGIRETLRQEYEGEATAWSFSETGFQLFVPYSIFVCRAAHL